MRQGVLPAVTKRFDAGGGHDNAMNCRWFGPLLDLAVWRRMVLTMRLVKASLKNRSQL
jgi:hypothetical protein